MRSHDRAFPRFDDGYAPSRRALAPGKQTLTEGGNPGPGPSSAARDGEPPSREPGGDPFVHEASEQRAGDWPADSSLMQAMGLGALAGEAGAPNAGFAAVESAAPSAAASKGAASTGSRAASAQATQAKQRANPLTAATSQPSPAREPAEAERTAVHDKLLGLESVYQLYRQYTATSLRAGAGLPVGPTSAIERHLGAKASTPDEQRAQLEQQLARHGFSSIAEFAAYLTRFEHAFERRAARITFDLLARYADKLHREAQHYRDPRVIQQLYTRLAGFRAQHDAFEHNLQRYSDEASTALHDRAAEQQRLPGNGGLARKPSPPQGRQSEQNARAAKASAAAQLQDLARDYPIFAEDELPVELRLDKTRLAQVSEAQLAGLLQDHLATRQAAVVAARGQLEAEPALVYKMTRLMPTFYAQLEIQPGSIHDQIVQAKLHSGAISRMIGGLLLAVAAVALTVVSLGTAIPAIVAAGASLGAAALSTAMAYDEYQHYRTDHALANAGFADDPSELWLALAIVGAGVDLAAAAKAVRVLAPAARALDHGGPLADFTSTLDALRRSQQLDQRLAAAAEHAAAARTAYTAARSQLTTALGKAYAFPGPFTDPAVYRALVQMAAAKIREGGHSLTAFLAELKQARLAAKLGELTPEELTQAKQAWAQGERLATENQIADETFTAGHLDLAAIRATTRAAGVSTAVGDRLVHVLEVAKLDATTALKLTPEVLVRLTDPRTIEQLERVATLQQSGRITGLSDWLGFIATKADSDLANVVGELREAIRRTQESTTTIVNIGGDARVPIRPGTNERMQSFDMTIEAEHGRVAASIEVTSIHDPIRNEADIGPAIKHATNKIRSRLSDGMAIPGDERHATILAEIAGPRTRKGGTQVIAANGDKFLRTADGRVISEGNLYMSISRYLSENIAPGTLDAISLVDKNSGSLIATFRMNRSSGQWTFKIGDAQ